MLKWAIIFLSFPFFNYSQKNIFINLTPYFETEPFVLTQNYSFINGDLVKFNYFNYYISNVEITHDGGQISKFQNAVFHITHENHTIYLGYLNIEQIEHLAFKVGVPEELNTQEGALAQDISTYPENHALSFQSPSMYWGWQSGYMHMITGGYSDQNSDDEVAEFEGLFELHNLGNHNQQNVVINNVIQTNTADDLIDININCYVDRWVGDISLANVGVLHGEFGLNQQIMENIIPNAVFEQGDFADILVIIDDEFRLFHADNTLTVFSFSDKNSIIKLFNALGQEVFSKKINGKNVSISTIGYEPGIYTVLISQNGINITKKILLF